MDQREVVVIEISVKKIDLRETSDDDINKFVMDSVAYYKGFPDTGEVEKLLSWLFDRILCETGGEIPDKVLIVKK